MIKSIIALLFSILFLLAVSVTAGEETETIESIISIDAINWNNLAKVLPEKIEGFESGELDGGTFSMANPTDQSSKISHSSVERKFTKKMEDGSYKIFKIMIMDSGLNKMMITPYLIHMEYDTPDGYMKWTTVDKRKTALIIDKDKGEIDKIHLFTILAGRLIISIEGNEKTTVEENKGIAGLVDYDALNGFLKPSVLTEDKK